MSKTLKFAPDLVPLVLSGAKTSTWRMWDDKNISGNDVIEFLEYGDNIAFATAQVTSVVEKPFGELTDEDKKGHETFKTAEDMYETYTNYYKKPVGPETIVKIIHFKLLSTQK